MSDYAKNLFTNLMNLCDSNDAFFFADQQLNGVTFRIFNYRLATYSHFLEPDALECRGIMFEVDESGNMVRLASHPQQKFFNLNENPFTMDLAITDSTIERIEMKEDGSLMSSFVYDTGDGFKRLGIKSKGSLHSDQCVMTNRFLHSHKALADELLAIGKDEYTVNMELTSPNNRIVLNYDETNLVVLNVRCNKTGEFLRYGDLDHVKYPEIHRHWVPEAWHLGYDTSAALIFRAPEIVGIEGFIVYLRDGTVFKLKTDWYLVQHRAKDNVDSPRRLFEAAINETTDDLRSLFTDNQQVLDKIDKMEQFAAQIYNKTVNDVEVFVDSHRHLIEADDRKEYAITGQRMLDGRTFGLAMQAYQHARDPDNAKPVNYKAFCLKHWRDWGLTDDSALRED